MPTRFTAGPRWAALMAALAVASACAHLPEYARPRMAPPAALPETAPSGFPYRTLAPEDFRAAALPPEMAAHGARINAHAAVHIRPTGASRFRMSRGELDGRTYVFGSIERLAFEAVMLPDRSWLNPALAPGLQSYVLQHEQVHFALTEIAARRLTRDSRPWAAELLVVRATAEEVRAELAGLIRGRIHAAMRQNLERHTAFDEDTSLFHHAGRQQWWFGRVMEELEQTGVEPAASD